MFFLSHPGKQLEEHLLNTYTIGTRRHRLCIDSVLMSSDDLNKIIELSLKFHDLGKATSYFQTYIRSINDDKCEFVEEGLKNHGLISGVLAFSMSLEILNSIELSYLIYIVVSRHHGNLKNIIDYRTELTSFQGEENDALLKQFESIDIEEFNKLIKKLVPTEKKIELTRTKFLESIECMSSRKTKNIINKMVKLEGKSSLGELFLIINYIFSILIYSDKTEAIYHSTNIKINDYFELYENIDSVELNKNIVSDYIKKNFHQASELNSIRADIFKNIDCNTENIDIKNQYIFSVNLPTGTGKTLATLNSAIKISKSIEEKYNISSKIIYVLPFTSIIDQNHEVFTNVLGNDDTKYIIKHHYLSQKDYKDENSEKTNQDADISQNLFEGFDSKIVVTTLYQLLHSIFTNKNRYLKKFSSFSGSVIIIDEVQCLKFEHWGLVEEVFYNLARIFNVRFIFMTATMPLIFNKYREYLIELVTDKKQYFEKLDRIFINLKYYNQGFINEDSLLNLIGDYIGTGKYKKILVVLNTVNISVVFFKKIEEIYNESKYSLYYVSTNIIPKERRERIKSIKDRDEPSIIVTTQIVEAGVDIDVDLVIRDFAPLDSINQTCGRCNRNGIKQKGEVILVNILNEKKNKGYANSIYDKALLDATANVIKNKDIILEKELFQLSEDYYRLLLDTKSTDMTIELKEAVKNIEHKKFEMGKAGIFKVIDNDVKQVDVFVEIDESSTLLWRRYIKVRKIKDVFKRKKELSKFKSEFLDYCLSVPEYIFKKHLDISKGDDLKFTKITKEMLHDMYDKKTGFIREVKTECFF